MTKQIALATIFTSGLVSILLATAWITFGAAELGAIIYFIVPLIICIGTILLFVLTDKIFQQRRLGLAIGFTAINILTGIFMRLDFYYNFINW